MKKNIKESVQSIKIKYPGKLPVFVIKSKHDKILPTINNNKFLVSQDFKVADLMTLVRRRIDIGREDSLFFFINDKVIPSSTENLGKLYSEYKNEDDLLIINYCGENVFGNL